MRVTGCSQASLLYSPLVPAVGEDITISIAAASLQCLDEFRFRQKKIWLRYWYRHFWLIPVTYTEFRSLTSSSQSFAYWYVYQMIRWKLKKCDMKLHLVLQKIFQLIVNCIRKKLGSKWSVNASSLFNKLTRRRYRDRLWEQNHSSKALCTYKHSVQGVPVCKTY